MKRFFDKVDKTQGGCWIWTAAKRNKNRDSYGCLKYKGKMIDAHRMSWIIHNGEIPLGMCICHKCDVRLCVNPDHLFLGTHSGNMVDALSKGRINIPEGDKFKKGHIALNKSIGLDKAKKLKHAIKNRGDKTLKSISEEFEVKYQLVRDINCGRSYINI